MCGEGIYTYMRWTWALVTWAFHGPWTSYLFVSAALLHTLFLRFILEENIMASDLLAAHGTMGQRARVHKFLQDGDQAVTRKTPEVLKCNYGPEVDLVYSKYAIRFPELVENGSSSRRSQPDNDLLQAGDTSLRLNEAKTKIIIGASGAIPALINLLENERTRGKKDAATTLFNLRDSDNLACISKLCTVIPLMELAKNGSERAQRKAKSLLEHLQRAQQVQHLHQNSVTLVHGLMRDLRGIAMATTCRRTYGLLFDWLYLYHMPILLKGISHWADTPMVNHVMSQWKSMFMESYELSFDPRPDIRHNSLHLINGVGEFLIGNNGLKCLCPLRKQLSYFSFVYLQKNRFLNWQHQLCKNPKPNPDIKPLFVDHSCGQSQPNGARATSLINNPLMGVVPKLPTGFPPLGAHGTFQATPTTLRSSLVG
ncbi:topless-related protein 4-like protein isoform X1 [Tanacetum coccineum]